jgi:ABC-2 type transport system ATP-binding protein
MTEHGPVVLTEGLTKRYGDLVALDHLSIQVERGQVLGFIGPNGAGKTTTIKILVGLAKPTSGRAVIASCDCTRQSQQIKRLVGYMPDVFGSYDNMRVREYLDFFGAAFGIPRARRLRRIDEVMEVAGATYMKDRYVESLSHGMRQRVAVARTLLHDPPVMILDEPANGLDPQARIEMRELLLHLAQMGKTLIVTSHILPELSRICDVVAIVTKGKLCAFGTLDQIMARVRQRRVYEVELLHPQMVQPMADLLRQGLEPGAVVSASNKDAQVHFSTALDAAKLADLLARAVGQGLAVTQFMEAHADLEDAFLSVTRDA